MCTYINSTQCIDLNQVIHLFISNSLALSLSLLRSLSLLYLSILIPCMVSELYRSMETPELITPSTTNGSSSIASFTMKTFANPVSIKFDEDNFLTWRQQALHSIKGHNLQKDLYKDKVP